MTFFLIILVVSCGGIAALYLRHRADCEEISRSRLISGQGISYFALFVYCMESIVEGVFLVWRTYVWGHVLRFTEKRLRWVRIIILKIERLLFRATHRLRNAVQQHENGVMQNENGEQDSNNKNLPP
ncbi:MAG TPA: hypothetical protein VJC20_01290 [Candidatus Paceibacterota bacterium]